MKQASRVCALCVAVAALTAACSKRNASPPRGDALIQAPDASSRAEVQAPAARCQDVQWHEVTLISERAQARRAAGEACAACVEELAGCLDRQTDCSGRCGACLGEALCEHPENALVARGHLDATEDDLHDAGRGLRIGAHDIERLVGASPDGRFMVTVASSAPQRRSWVVSPRRDYFIVNQRDQRLWKFSQPGTNCPSPLVSPGGRWLISSCAGVVRVHELASGFLYHELEVAPDATLESSQVGSDRWIALRHPEGWRRHDLRSGEVSDVLASAPADARHLALDRSGQWVAFERAGEVFAGRIGADAPPASVVKARPESLRWEGDGALLVHELAHIRRFEGGTWRELARLERPLFRDLFPLRDTYAAGKLTRSGEFVLHAPLEAEARRLTPFPEGYTLRAFGYSHGYEYPIQGVRPLEDGRVVAGSTLFGVIFFDERGAVLEDGLDRGPILWTAPGRSADEVLVARPHGVTRWHLGEQRGEALGLALSYAHHAVAMNTQGGLVATGTGLTSHGLLDQSGRLLVRAGEHIEAELSTSDAIHDAAVTPAGDVHVATMKELLIFTHDRSEGRFELQRRHPLPAIASRADRIALTRDGEYIQIFQGGELQIREVANFSKVIFELDATSCAISAGGEVVGCYVSAGGASEVELVTFELPSGRELHRQPAMITTAQVLRVSRDGSLIALGDELPYSVSSVADLERRVMWRPPVDHVLFRDRDVILVDQAHIQVIDADALE